MSKDKVRIAIVGCGNISQMNVPGYLAHPECEVYALCDPVSSKADIRAKQWGISTKIYTEFEQVLSDPNVDAVELLTPTHLHAEQSVAALAAGKHVSCQKPMCTTIAEADQIIAAVEKFQAKFRVTENFIYYPPIVKAKELIDSGAIGEPSLVRIHTTRGGSIRGSQVERDPEALVWRRDPKLNPGGMIFDDGVHKYATAMKWVGDIERVLGIVTRTDDFIMEAPATVIWKFKDKKCLGILDDTYASEMTVRSKYGASDNYFEIHGSKGIIHVTRCTGEIMDLPPVLLITGTETISYDVPSDWMESFNAAAKDFIDSILRDIQPDLDPHFSKRTIQVALAIYQAAETGESVETDSMVG